MSTNSTDTVVCRLRFRRKVGAVINVAVEVGARGVVAQSLERAARRIGFKGRELKKLVRDSGKEAAHCSRWIYLLSRKREWEFRKVGA